MFKINFDSSDFFSDLCCEISANTADDILTYSANMLHVEKEILMCFPIGPNTSENKVELLQNYIEEVKQNVDEYMWLYERLNDTTSKAILANLLLYRIYPNKIFLENAKNLSGVQYFESEIIPPEPMAVFVDYGNIGEAVAEGFIRYNPEYDSIHVYDSCAHNCSEIAERLTDFPNAHINKCVPSDTGNIVYRMDDEVEAKISYIKMDFYGQECDVLIGAKNHIINESPCLAVCVDNKIGNLRLIPRLIDAIKDEYTFHIRHYDDTNLEKTVVYATHKDKKALKSNSEFIKCTKRVVTLAPVSQNWENAMLTKDCGIIPYLLHKNYGYEAIMVGGRNGEYPYLDSYVKGMKMEFIPSEEYYSEMVKYIERNALEIDLLVVYGLYETNYAHTVRYKQLNPNGIVYVATDANNRWTEAIDSTDSRFVQFMDSCDVIGASCRDMAKHLNEKWPWNIEVIPNGYLNFVKEIDEVDYTQKEKTIYTVSRLGMSQKNIMLLLRAFTLIANDIPGWTLKLTGTTDGECSDEIETFLSNNTKFSDRIVFTGPIFDKKLLFNEYAKAKVFALSSNVEGGTPNVIAEALSFGCAMLTTKIDSYNDVIANGSCGLVSPIDDVEAYADNLKKICLNEKMQMDFGVQARLHYERNFSFEKIVDKLHYLLNEGVLDDRKIS